jgi:hypothetical protein
MQRLYVPDYIEIQKSTNRPGVIPGRFFCLNCDWFDLHGYDDFLSASGFTRFRDFQDGLELIFDKNCGSKA